MNEFDALKVIVDTAIKHGQHNQKLHGRRFGPDTGGGAGGGTDYSLLAQEPKDVVPGQGYDKDDDSQKRYDLLGSAMNEEITWNERRSLREYQEYNHEEINGYLSGRVAVWDIHGNSINDGAKDIAVLVRHIDDVMRRSHLPAETVLLRGISMGEGSRLEELTKIGNVVERSGFLSTTTDMHIAMEFSKRDAQDPLGVKQVIMHIRAPAGSNAIHVNNATGAETMDENEVLLPRGSQMIVRAVREQAYKTANGQSDSVTHVYLDLLPWEESPQPIDIVGGFTVVDLPPGA